MMLLDGTGVPTTGLSVDEVAGLLITTFDDVEDVLEIEITGVLANGFGVEVDDDEGGGLGTGLLAETGEAIATGKLEGLGRTRDDSVAAASGALDTAPNEGVDKEAEGATIEGVPCDA